jgi:Ca2+-binding RTX toxin-like protein
MLQGNGEGNTFYGNGGNDELLGEGGHDYIEGGDGMDTISGGEGLDWLLGNGGADLFRFDTRASAGNVDTLADFSLAQGDRIALETGAFGFDAVVYGDGYMLNGTLKSSAFVVGTRAATTAQKIIYDQATGALYYDADGSNVGVQVQFAKVAAGTALTAAHFQMFTL